MAKSIFICSRNRMASDIDDKLTNICNEIAPDNISPKTPKIISGSKIAIAVMNPTDNILIRDNSLLMGLVFTHKDTWHIPNKDYPDGSYAIFRNSNDYCEILSDATASRTVWYYIDENIFVCSTSQRAIVMFINSFQFNEKVITWMLSTGSLGPEYSWDRRIKRIQPDSSVVLDNKKWSLSIKTNKIAINPVNLPDSTHKQSLTRELQSTFDKLKIDYSKWFLPLSGGYDSRGILCLLKNKTKTVKNLKTITWGVASASDVVESDAAVAKDLSNHLGVNHKYYSTDLSQEPLEKIFERFIRNGEGRIDHISGYMDGFHIWKTLYNDGVEGIIRGDEGFGWVNVSSPLYVRLSTGSNLCKDMANLKKYRKYGFAKQEVPLWFKRHKNESLPMWRDRIYLQFRLPTIIAALSDLKLSYVEQISPLLSKSILECVKQMPDHLRTEKHLFKEIINDFGINIRYATKDAIANPVEILKTKESSELLKSTLSSNDVSSIFPQAFLREIINNLSYRSDTSTVERNSSHKIELAKFIPNKIINIIRKYIFKPKVDYNVLAFRIYIVWKMHEILSEDSMTIKNQE